MELKRDSDIVVPSAGKKFYCAASGRGKKPIVSFYLRVAGYDVISTWDVDDDGTYFPTSKNRAERDADQLFTCDIFTCEIGDKLSGGGKHTELGMAIALNKWIVLVGELEENVFHSLFIPVSFDDFRLVFPGTQAEEGGNGEQL